MRNKLLVVFGGLIISAFVALYVYAKSVCVGDISPDESFLLSQAWRFSNGDIPFVHEWHLSLLYGFLMTPLMVVYKYFGGNSEGILLHFRVMMAVLWFICVFFLYRRWRIIDRLGAVLGLAAFAFLPPWSCYNFGYNCLGVLATLSSITCYATNIEKRAWLYVFSGIFLAIAVLCCPYLVVGYLIYAAWGFLKNRRPLLLVTLGASLVGIVFCATLFSRVPLSSVSDSIPGLMSDPEHASKPLFRMMVDCVGHMFFITHDFAYGHAALLLAFLGVAVVAAVDRHSTQRSSAYVAIILVLLLGFYAYYFFQPMVGRHVVIFPVTLAGLCAACVAKDSRCKKLLMSAYLPAVVYAVAISCTSNMGYYSMTFAMGVAVVPSVMMIVFAGWKFFVLLVPHFIVVLLTLWGSITALGNTDWIEEQNGPARGMRLSKTYKEVYDEFWSDTEELRNDENVNVLLHFNHRHQWLNIASDKKIASFSSWMSGANGRTIDRLKLYYEKNPDRTPDAIFVPKGDLEAAKEFLNMGYRECRLSSGNIIMRRGDCD